ncbi:hypothetical protein RHMOL_Rhmol10G0049400 [Rhododendron molle]|uniref:Uncharacterized protein n=1 Tax=Rhododendron molle TaxID=49168 RepID=A0ACC0LYX5_RHOML|nr:hypothetical protein RHMOL_Rhmol10G0049400 [Rhododendron molle]
MVAGTNQIVKEALEDCFETQRDWILGFFGKLVCNSSLEAELCGIYRGLTIFWRKVWQMLLLNQILLWLLSSSMKAI